jgi:uncharacterized membrane protein YtjA (UPF0391 family)
MPGRGDQIDSSRRAVPHLKTVFKATRKIAIFPPRSIWTIRSKVWVEVRSTVEAMVMLRWAFIFLIISLVAGALGFSGVSAGAGRVSKILFIAFGVLFLLVVLVAYVVGEAFF